MSFYSTVYLTIALAYVSGAEGAKEAGMLVREDDGPGRGYPQFAAAAVAREHQAPRGRSSYAEVTAASSERGDSPNDKPGTVDALLNEIDGLLGDTSPPAGASGRAAAGTVWPWFAIEDPSLAAMNAVEADGEAASHGHKPDPDRKLQLSKFALSPEQANALKVFYEPASPEDNGWTQRKSKRDASPVEIKKYMYKEVLTKTPSVVKKSLPRTLTRLFISSADTAENLRGRTLMEIEDKPFPGVAVKYQGDPSNPIEGWDSSKPAYLVKASDMESDIAYMMTQINELEAFQKLSTGKNKMMVEDRLEELKSKLQGWERFSVKH